MTDRNVIACCCKCFWETLIRGFVPGLAKSFCLTVPGYSLLWHDGRKKCLSAASSRAAIGSRHENSFATPATEDKSLLSKEFTLVSCAFRRIDEFKSLSLSSASQRVLFIIWIIYQWKSQGSVSRFFLSKKRTLDRSSLAWLHIKQIKELPLEKFSIIQIVE